MILVTDQTLVANWVNAQMPFPMDFGPYTAFGFHRDGQMACGAVFNNFRRMIYGDRISVTFAAKPGGLTRPILRAFFSYVFGQPRMIRLESVASVKNLAALELNRRVGFVPEGVARRGWDGKTNAQHFRMLRTECKWLGGWRAAPAGKQDGQERASSPTAT